MLEKCSFSKWRVVLCTFVYYYYFDVNFVHRYYVVKYQLFLIELHRMFSLINRTPDRIQPMLDCLQNHITQQGRADMTECASIITSVS